MNVCLSVCLYARISHIFTWGQWARIKDDACVWLSSPGAIYDCCSCCANSSIATSDEDAVVTTLMLAVNDVDVMSRRRTKRSTYMMNVRSTFSRHSVSLSVDSCYSRLSVCLSVSSMMTLLSLHFVRRLTYSRDDLMMIASRDVTVTHQLMMLVCH